MVLLRPNRFPGQLRRVVEASFPTEVFRPEGDKAEWDRAYEKLVSLMK